MSFLRYVSSPTHTPHAIDIDTNLNVEVPSPGPPSVGLFLQVPSPKKSPVPLIPASSPAFFLMLDEFQHQQIRGRAIKFVGGVTCKAGKSCHPRDYLPPHQHRRLPIGRKGDGSPLNVPPRPALERITSPPQAAVVVVYQFNSLVMQV